VSQGSQPAAIFPTVTSLSRFLAETVHCVSSNGEFLCRQFIRAEERDRADRGLARSAPQGITSGSDKKSSAARYHARDYSPERSSYRGNEQYERDRRCNSDAALLGAAWRFHRDFDYSDLDLLFLNRMENSATINLDESNFDREITQSDEPVIVDFWAEWCGPCKMIAPLLDEIAREKAGIIKVAKVNVDENQSLSLKYNIRAIPALLFFKNGQLRDQVTGMTSKKDLLGRIDALA
jgi:thioredoxin 1